eukprot:6459362-Amphidinium_carterae.1
MLAAVLIESHEKRHETLLTFLKQRKAPVLLSIAVQADFTERIGSDHKLRTSTCSQLLLVSAWAENSNGAGQKDLLCSFQASSGCE